MAPTADTIEPGTAPELDEGEHPYWRRNLVVCLCGSFTTIIAMTLLLPYLPPYVEQLGAHGQGAVARWSSFAYAATFLTAGLSAPLWGRLGDRYGRKSMLVRAAFGMAMTTAALGLVQTPSELVALRLIVGLAGGYASGSTILVADQTPRSRNAWALGVLSIGTMTGSIVGPLVGGWIPGLIGARATFFAAGALIFVAAIGTAAFLKEHRTNAQAGTRRTASAGARAAGAASRIEKRRLLVLFAAAGMVMFATTSVEPIITLVVRHLDPATRHVSGLAGIVFTASAIGSILAAPRMGRLADRWGHVKVIVSCLLAAATLALLQAAVHQVWQLVALRFLMGLALGGILPSVTAATRRLAAEHRVGGILGYGVSSQYAGQVAGPVVGGMIAAQVSLAAVFLATAGVLGATAVLLSIFSKPLRTYSPSG